LIRRLVKDGHRIVVTGAPDAREKSIIGRILGEGSGAVDLSGQLNLREMAALTARARLFFGVDSAPMHIAAAMGTPVVVLFGPSDERAWGPWKVPHRVVTTDHVCRPCNNDGCGGGKVSECLTQLPVDRVHSAINELPAAGTSVLVTLVRDTVTIVALVAILLTSNWKLTLIAFLVIPPIAIVVRAFSKRLRTMSRESQRAVGGVAEVLDEAISNQRVVR